MKEIDLEIVVRALEKLKDGKRPGKHCEKREKILNCGQFGICEKESTQSTFQRAVENSVGKVENKLKNKDENIQGIDE
ncbi:hypothetical protein [Caproicibacterium lactatifermentans]|uniref:Uncharacterized protein n=1 Tax=Caproicibacterium lactatifermentans TaxID=2666138 RepID=A0A859DSA7_9FIRM|nr:hypothetical protein [Caproicibacterium lactatifermentans]MDD4807227.1 hypothetical protein [Oscillospiraceae bacterium]QKN23003.1 hypothetical protein GJQ69_00010 [Caproicibacterium lactatifermentans]QKO30391.1 hypothetical protein GKP14_04770 [Caproicibacterium lactatifermentans]